MCSVGPVDGTELGGGSGGGPLEPTPVRSGPGCSGVAGLDVIGLPGSRWAFAEARESCRSPSGRVSTVFCRLGVLFAHGVQSHGHTRCMGWDEAAGRADDSDKCPLGADKLLRR